MSPHVRGRIAVACSLPALLTACSLNGLSINTAGLLSQARPVAAPSVGAANGPQQAPAGKSGFSQGVSGPGGAPASGSGNDAGQTSGGLQGRPLGPGQGRPQNGQQSGFQQGSGQPQGRPSGMPSYPSQGSASAAPSSAPTIDPTVPAVYKKIYGAYDMQVDGDYLVIKSHGEPDHDSPYYTNNLYTPDPNGGFAINPNRIVAQEVDLRIPLHPVEDPNHQETPMGPTGLAIDGVPFFNQYAAGRSPLTSEAVSFDQFGGHPNQDGEYHYHIEPTFLTGKYGKDALLGFMLDGFPVYGPVENGKTLASADLDTYHGHFGPTADYPSGVYHYHITADVPYITGTGFYGKAGTVLSGNGPGGQQTGGQQTGGQTSGGQMQGPPPSGGPSGGTTGGTTGGQMQGPRPTLPSGCPTPPPPGQRPSPIPGGIPAYCPTPPGGLQPQP